MSKTMWMPIELMEPNAATTAVGPGRRQGSTA